MAQAMSADAFACIPQKQLLVMVVHAKRLAVQEVGLISESYRYGQHVMLQFCEWHV